MDDKTRKSLLELLESDARLEAKELASMLSVPEKELKGEISRLEKAGVIRGYHAFVDWDKVEDEKVSALIELKVTPQRGNGFDKIAEKIYQYPEVRTLLLMSGGYDFTVILRRATLKEVSHFVASKLAVIDGVQSTATHFILVPYKHDGVVMTKKEKTKRVMVTP